MIKTFDQWLTEAKKRQASQRAVRRLEQILTKHQRDEITSLSTRMKMVFDDRSLVPIFGTRAEMRVKLEEVKASLEKTKVEIITLKAKPIPGPELWRMARDTLFNVNIGGSFDDMVREELTDLYTDYRHQLCQDIPLPHEVSLAIIEDALKAGSPSMGGGWLGWTQPEEDELIKLGSLYGGVNIDQLTTAHCYNLLDILEFHQPEDDAWNALLAAANKLGLTQESRLHESLDAILVCDDVFIPFKALSDSDKALYKLHTMLVNTFTEGHNWACEWGDYMASQFYTHDQAQLSKWEFHDGDNMELVEALLAAQVPLPITAWDRFSTSIPEGSQDTLDELIANDTARTLFPDLSLDSLEVVEISRLLSWTVDWHSDLWASGELILQDNEATPAEVKAFIQQTEAA